MNKVIPVSVLLVCSSFGIHSALASCTDIPGSNQTENLLIVERASDNNFNQKSIETMSDFMNAERYIQHTPNGADGIEHLSKFISFLKEKMPSFRVERHRALAENDLVVTQSIDYVDDKAIEISVDWYRVNDKKITEHWDVVVEVTDPKDAEHYVQGSLLDDDKCFDKEVIRSSALEFVYSFFGDGSTKSSLFSDDFQIRHINKGRSVSFDQSTVSDWLDNMRSQDKSGSKVEVARVIVMNDFSAVHFKWSMSGKSYAATAILSLDAPSSIKEVWLAILEIPEDNKNPRDPVF